MSSNTFMRVDEVAETLGISKSYAYKIVQKLNAELKEKGYLSVENLMDTPFSFLKMDCRIRQKGKTNWMLYFTSRLMKHISGLKAIRFTPTIRLLREYLLRLR